MEVILTIQDKQEVLRYLEYHGQQMEESLSDQVDACMAAVNAAAKPRFVLREFDMQEDGNLPVECFFLSGKDIQKHLLSCKKIVLFAATLGADVELAIRRASVRNMADSVIMDSCASVLIEAFGDSIDADLRSKYKEMYLTTRYSPGYGDLPIEIQTQFVRLLDATKRIGLNVSGSGIMVPRKSVTAIIGISEIPSAPKENSCKGCNIMKACRFLRRGVTCGR